MSVIDYHADLNVLVSVKGHPYPRDGFFELFEQMQGVTYTAVEQPASQVMLCPENAAGYDAVVLYDMPGIDFSSQPPELVPPGEAFKSQFLELLQQGKGMVFLHHAIAGWPLWPEYGDIIGGRFFYLPTEVRGVPSCDSGYRHNVEHHIECVVEHPVTSGLPQSFTMTDELYLYHVEESGIIPLLRSHASFQREQFYSAQRAVNGEMYSREGWNPKAGSSLVGWVKHYRNSPIVYLQMGDGLQAYENPSFQMLLQNAIQWVASSEASHWAGKRYMAESELRTDID